ncbi:MAG TPA: hypothetical protein VII28_14230 [Puia sp.]
MSGTLSGNAVYWKNGAPVFLSERGKAYSIFVNGSDIYVCGSIEKDNNSFGTNWVRVESLASYWKNGKVVYLENQAWSEATGMAIQGDDIYIVGFIAESDSVWHPVYWKNGVLNYLSPESKGSATGIAVSGQQVYISGNTYGNSSDSAIVWENGKKVFFGEIGPMNAVGYNGTDMFATGYLYGVPMYWVGNKKVELYNNGIPDAIAFSGTDVYFGGTVRPGLDDNYAAIWKNDSLTILTDQYTNSNVSGIAVAGKDVYAVGYINDEFINFSPVYWKNGVMVKLGSNGWVYSITIVR